MPLVTYLLWKVEYTFSGKPNVTFILTKANRIILQNKNVDIGFLCFYDAFAASGRDMTSNTCGALLCFSTKGKISMPWVYVT